MKTTAFVIATWAIILLAGCGPQQDSAAALPLPTPALPRATTIEVEPTYTPVGFELGAWTTTTNVSSWGVVPIYIRFTQDMHGVVGAVMQVTAYYQNVPNVGVTSAPTDHDGSTVANLSLTGLYSIQPVQVYVTTNWQGHAYSCFTFFSVGGVAVPTNSPNPYSNYRNTPPAHGTPLPAPTVKHHKP